MKPGPMRTKILKAINDSQDGRPLGRMFGGNLSGAVQRIYVATPSDHLNTFLVASVAQAEDVERVETDLGYAISELTKALEAVRKVER